MKPYFNPFKQKIIPSYTIRNSKIDLEQPSGHDSDDELSIDLEKPLNSNAFVDENLFSSSPPEGGLKNKNRRCIDMATMVNT